MPSNTRAKPRTSSPSGLPPVFIALLYQTDLLQRGGNAFILLLQETGEFITGKIEIHPLLVGKDLLPPIAFHRRVDHLQQCGLLRIIDPGWGTTARQFARSTFTPCSFRVGISVSGSLSGDEMASALSSPDLIWPTHSPRPLMPTVTWPPMIA